VNGIHKNVGFLQISSRMFTIVPLYSPFLVPVFFPERIEKKMSKIVILYAIVPQLVEVNTQLESNRVLGRRVYLRMT